MLVNCLIIWFIAGFVVTLAMGIENTTITMSILKAKLWKAVLVCSIGGPCAVILLLTFRGVKVLHKWWNNMMIPEILDFISSSIKGWIEK